MAAPKYLEKYGTPTKPEDLSLHNCIIFTRLADYTGTGNAWEYCDPPTGNSITIAVSGNYSSDNSSTVRQMTLAGIGIYHGPNWLFGDDVAQGNLREILVGYQMLPFPIYLLHPSAGYVPLRLKVLMDYLAHEFRLNPWVAG